MFESAYRLTLFALYQITVAVGIVLLPLAVLTRRVGFNLPMNRVIAKLGDAYEHADAR